MGTATSVKKPGVPESFADPFPLMSLQDWKQFQDRTFGDFFNELKEDTKQRDAYVRNNAWFILTTENADYLANFLKDKKTLEVGAGTGYMAAHLRKRGVTDYRAVDLWSSWYWTHDIANFGSECGDALEVDFDPYDIIIMTWPPMGSDFAHKVAKKMRVGQILIHEGEGYMGCTGNDAFYYYLDAAFERDGEMTMELERHHIRFAGMRDDWSVFKKVKDV
ncbi:class I SAM-dependent methyltransferase [Streptomyces sp. CHB9.2]|uniref:class I SAM-dependent methyltransferase n=1 Tax=Streptomyces sp. CHB9.2 TaxID=2841670 RepID=UPI00209434C5|nr:class I SAM-dependent methyltransferase [Streptomyces sp. CHB9.2]MCO6704694.1 class I SAM-dependent methyltransferase [Streptomyces sp. CHB9.2]